jgi:hypothetical protein
MKSLASALVLVLLTGCPSAGVNIDKPTPMVTEIPAEPLVIRYAAKLGELLEEKPNLNRAFQLAETCMTLYLINGPQLYDKLSSDEKYRLKRAEPYLKEQTGRILLRNAIENFYYVFITADTEQVQFKAAALRMLMRILDDMADEASLRTLDAGTSNEFRAAILNCTYRYASAALATRYEELTQTKGRVGARAGAIADSLLRLAEYPSIKDEFKAHLRKLSDEVRANPEACFKIPADARGETLIREGVGHQDGGVRETASGGDAKVAYAHFQHALTCLVLAGEVLEDKERQRYSGELDRIQLILAQLEKIMQKGQ